MNDIRRIILEQLVEGKITIDTSKKFIQSLGQLNSFNDEAAVIGIDCRYPKANNIEEFWSNIVGGVNCIGLPSEERVYKMKRDFEQYYGVHIEKEMLRVGGYMHEIDKFDAHFFSIRDKEAKFMDFWQRIMLEVTYHAVEDAGIKLSEINGSDTGVFIGRDNSSQSSYGKMIQDTSPYVTSGSYAAVLASRISHYFNLTGPNMVIDTACSSAMSALSRALMSLRSRECSMAIVGGINILENLFEISDNPMRRIIAKDKKVKTFDAQAKGTVLSEGVGVLVLKRKEDAVRDNNNIYAIIRGIAVKNDGGVKNISSPNPLVEEQVIIQAWKSADVSPEHISYIEAHGTGTLVGDSIEFRAISEAFKKFTNRKKICALGAVKPNIGHSVGASGLASMIKAILCMNKSVLPQNINFKTPNPYLDLDNSALYINNFTHTWVEERKLCGVNSFGYSGTNVHVLLEKPNIDNKCIREPRYYIFVLSAKSKESLLQITRKYVTLLQDDIDMYRMCYTLANGKNHFNHRLAIVVENKVDLKEQLSLVCDKFLGGEDIGVKKIFYKVTYTTKRKRGKSDEYTIQMLEEMSNKVKYAKHMLNYQDRLLDVARWYVSGADIKWEEIYTEPIPYMHLPLYCFNRTSYWHDEKIKKS